MAKQARMAIWLSYMVPVYGTSAIYSAVRLISSVFFNTCWESSYILEICLIIICVVLPLVIVAIEAWTFSGTARYPWGVSRAPCWGSKKLSAAWYFEEPFDMSLSAPFKFAFSRRGNTLLNDYHKLLALASAIWQGDVALVKAEFLIKLAKDDLRLPRRQELPEDAYLVAPSLKIHNFWMAMWSNSIDTRRTLMIYFIGKFLFAFIFLHDAVLAFQDESCDVEVAAIFATAYFLVWPTFVYYQSVLAPFLIYIAEWQVVTLSYMWLSVDHPDPTGEQLRYVARCLEAHGSKVAVFWDYASLYQSPRSVKEDESFKRCLKGGQINIFYGSRLTDVWTLTCTPLWSSRKYTESGWCCTEKYISSVIKPHDSLLDIGVILESCWQKVVTVATCALSQHVAFRPASAETVRTILSLVASFLDLRDEVDASVCYTMKQVSWSEDVVPRCSSTREVPIAPDDFEKQSKRLTFTNGSDIEVVQKIYARSYQHCIRNAVRLNFSALGWTDDDMNSLAKVLGDAKALRMLRLDGNPGITDSGLRVLLPSIQGLWALSLRGTGVSDIAGIKQALPNLRYLEGLEGVAHVEMRCCRLNSRRRVAPGDVPQFLQ